MNIKLFNKNFLSPQASLALSFFIIIIVGSLLLMLPISVKGDHPSFLDALFTATSAVCVTGLAVVDTYTHWSLFGQIVILFLIQIGGLGIMTFSSFVIFIIARRLGIRDREMIEQNFTGEANKSLGQLLRAIILLTFLFEGVGALILSIRFAHDYPGFYAVYLGVFHSVAAFCNAGFSLFQTSLMHYRGDFIVNITIIFLIVAGGLGFWVLFDLRNIVKHRQNVHSTSLNTRLVVYVTLFLISSGAVLLLIIEWQKALLNMPFGEKLLASLFQSVTARTAGFNTLDMAALTNSSLFLLIFLMLIGASPGSCGGGIKTTTFAIIMAMIYTRMINQKQVQLFKRGIPDSLVSKAIAITASAVVLIGLLSFLLLITETSSHPDIHERTLFIQVIFEAVSAFGTVGLSMGLTPVLTSLGKTLIIILMYIGRIGPITLTMALAGVQIKNIRYAEDNVYVG